MANALDEITGPVNEAGRDINVINKVLPVTVGMGSTIFEICLWLVPIAVAVLIPYLYGLSWAIAAAGIVPGLIWLYIKMKAENYLQQLEQKLQAEASRVHNYEEQIVRIIDDLIPEVQAAINQDKDIMKGVAALRSGINQDADPNTRSSQIDTVAAHLFPQIEAYPELKSQQHIADLMQKNYYLRLEITSAREVYNNRVFQWNRDIFDWPAKQIVAAKNKWETRVPFTASAEVRQQVKSSLSAGLNA